MSKARIEDCEKFTLDNPGKWTIQGFSKAGDRTGFMLYPLKILLDAGLSTYLIPNAVLISHSHTDHSLALPNILTGRLKPVKGQEQLLGRPVYMPNNCVVPIQRLMEAAIMLSDNDKADVKSNYVNLLSQEYIYRRQGYQPQVVKKGDVFQIPGVKNVEVEVLEAYHNTECYGYGFISIKKKLKPTFQQAGKEAIIAAKKAGEEIYDTIKVPEFLYFVDSTIQNFTQHTEWQKYPVITAECTGFPGIHPVEVMTQRFHSHLSLIEPIMEQWPEKQWILIHTSTTVKNDRLVEEEVRLREKGLNVTFVKQ